jgi:hypothetical protein
VTLDNNDPRYLLNLNNDETKMLRIFPQNFACHDKMVNPPALSLHKREDGKKWPQFLATCAGKSKF